MNQLAKNLACEWARDNIRINYVAPWFITTPLTEPVRTIHTPYAQLIFSALIKFINYIYIYKRNKIGRGLF